MFTSILTKPTGNGSEQISHQTVPSKREWWRLWVTKELIMTQLRVYGPVSCLSFGEFPLFHCSTSSSVPVSILISWNARLYPLCSLTVGFSDPRGRFILLAEWLFSESSLRDVLFQEWHISLGMTFCLTEVGGRSGEAPTQEKIASLCAGRKTLRWWTAWFGGCVWVSHSSEAVLSTPSEEELMDLTSRILTSFKAKDREGIAWILNSYEIHFIGRK